MSRKLIKLSTQEELKIFMSPQRQKLLREMRISGRPVNAKTVADMLEISTSSAQYHIKKLEKLGVIEFDHTETINGIIARYYRLTDADVNIGVELMDDKNNERYLIMQNHIRETFDGYIKCCSSGESNEEIAKMSEFIYGILHLKKEDSLELLNIVRDYLTSHEKKGPDTEAWEYVLMFYKTDTKKGEEEENGGAK